MKAKFVLEAAKYVTPAVILFGLLWAVAKPHAENFVNDSVNYRFVQVERHLSVIRNRQTEQERNLVRMDEKLSQLHSVQQEMRQDLKALLQK